jgi:hypothetical protein
VSLFISHAVRRKLGEAAAGAGKLPVTSFRAARELVAALGAAGGAAELNALSLLEESVHRVLRSAVSDDLFERTARAVESELGRERLSHLLREFDREFGLRPAADASSPAPGDDGVDEPGSSAAPVAPEATAAGADEEPAPPSSPPAAVPKPGGREPELLRELLTFWWVRTNPALERLNGLLDKSPITALPEFQAAGRKFREVLAEAPGIAVGDASLLESLEAPTRQAADSPIAQLRWILPRWRAILGEIEADLLAALDLAAEEHAPRFPPGHGPAEAPSLPSAGPEGPQGPTPPDTRSEGAGWPAAEVEARYTEDRDWMPRLVLIAKNALVWLQQLSREYERPIRRLDEIPSEVLARLAERGFSGLWLIGVWERSEASRRVKRLCGNPEAEASAYSLRGYRIAERLGGAEALADLRWRAGEHGLRLAADMVPNHTGIDSDWILEHPERFMSRSDCPFPVYTFDGPDLSPDPEVAIQIEDHYYERSDAAVVFRRTDKRTGEVRYLYHGNDGTSMPWNDTAQLDYLRPETREAVIEQILEVARSFSVIRFDAAMTLTRMHFQRLWFPQAGDAGAIPSRAERSLSPERFAELMPEEFWREVVDRVAEELPDTLLIAEAFWLLEGYFVRSLGMHRVYNSAFMHMLRDDDTAGYRKLLRETLEFDPAILGRYVSFMSNPDEKTAAEQFGTGDRYRGVCLLLATLPGLPMFAHGQVEGFTEHYGMEYGRSYRDEQPNPELVAWHEERLAPLLLRRELFAGTERFQLFDFRVGSGEVDEAVLAYANGTAEQRLLAVYNHSGRTVRGRIRDSVPRIGSDQDAVAADRESRLGVPLTAALALDPTRQRHQLCDLLTGAEREVDYRRLVEEGLELELRPYEFALLGPPLDEPRSS